MSPDDGGACRDASTADAVPRRDRRASTMTWTRSWIREPRLLLPVAVAASWVVLVLLMRREFWTLPAAEALVRERMVRPPGMQDLQGLAVRSGAEMLVIVALVWPGRAWIARVTTAALGAGVYFLATAPMALTSVALLHRRWLFGTAVVLLGMAAIGAMAGSIRRLRGSR
jgi:hypothetical protein